MKNLKVKKCYYRKEEELYLTIYWTKDSKVKKQRKINEYDLIFSTMFLL